MNINSVICIEKAHKNKNGLISISVLNLTNTLQNDKNNYFKLKMKNTLILVD
jgi:hypothetical protein